MAQGGSHSQATRPPMFAGKAKNTGHTPKKKRKKILWLGQCSQKHLSKGFSFWQGMMRVRSSEWLQPTRLLLSWCCGCQWLWNFFSHARQFGRIWSELGLRSTSLRTTNDLVICAHAWKTPTLAPPPWRRCPVLTLSWPAQTSSQTAAAGWPTFLMALAAAPVLWESHGGA